MTGIIEVRRHRDGFIAVTTLPDGSGIAVFHGNPKEAVARVKRIIEMLAKDLQPTDPKVEEFKKNMDEFLTDLREVSDMTFDETNEPDPENK